MPRVATVWWNKHKGAWCTDLGGARHVLAKGKTNKNLAKDKLRDLLDEQALLADINGTKTVAALCDAFLEDALHNLEKQTYTSYRYACQSLWIFMRRVRPTRSSLRTSRGLPAS